MDLVRVGKIIKPHGIRGEVLFFLTTDEPDRRLKRGNLLFDKDGRKYAVKGKRNFRSQILLSLSQIDSMEKAEEMRGKELFAEADQSNEEEIYFKDLLGLLVETAEGEEVGIVTDVFDNPQILLEVKQDEGKCLVPWSKDLVKQVDLKKGKIIMALPAGLLTACSY